MSDDINDLVQELGEGDPAEEAAQREIENEARSQGWFPKEQWKGRENDWVDAETFVRRGREILPIVRKALSDERRKNSDLEAKLLAQGATIAEMREYFVKIEEAATKNALASLKQQKRAALEAGDPATADAIDEQMDELKNSKSAVPTIKEPVAPTGIPPEVQKKVDAWIEDNPWYNEKNPKLLKYANGVALNLKQTQPNMSPDKILEQVAAEVQEAFPDFFAAPAAGMFESGGSQGGASPRRQAAGSKKGFGSLPDEAKAQFERFYDMGFYIKPGTKAKMDKKDAQAEYFSKYKD